MKIITVEECESTNSMLKKMISDNDLLPSFTFIRAVNQTKGRGQRGNTWEAVPGENLTFSFVIRPLQLNPSRNFIISEAAAVAVARFLKKFFITEDYSIEIKWPNDILVDNRKIAGILIENSLGPDGHILNSIIGIGININQATFTDKAPNATSLTALTGKRYDLQQLMNEISQIITVTIQQIIDAENQTNEDIPIKIEDYYHSCLWRKHGIHKWLQDSDQTVFNAYIVSVEPSGHLILKTSDGDIRRYLFKEVFPI